MIVFDEEVRPPAGAVEGMLVGNGGDSGVCTHADFEAGCVLSGAFDFASKMELVSLRDFPGSFFNGERNEGLRDKGEGEGGDDLGPGSRRSTELLVFDFSLLF